ncbi:hypothetical protein NXS19_007849 [Fusarium pseudograminearum]|uniref:Uncharacterized protein n=1 Tax=Fusarium pseudograminearum (strain CS3096) TaxID=1028729 RepID=K3VY22_FUSPC|nr:hypothetical protein FPSE_09918 [Fusarium pseudograminearum CS3096]EKJ69895.1 hypothetical protein FPSE_09918 [Fusarium pseudograminearum CS3096]KAF0645395.1 hypothetical protein FPSE5266_09918 [Fusarium pseudograminearum]QPC71822.1 hypothetical protein HYE68_002574 [Fusarium pseudograminearum]UZP40033.1 hypothetical protein NXS19_007849 [Fusarium pseudograminearum]
MKATFFSIFALAASAIASPVAQPAGVNPTPDTQEVRGAVANLENILKIAGVDQVVDEATKGSASKRDISSPAQLISVLQSGASNIKSKTSGFSGIADKVKAGDLTKSEGADKAIPGLEGVNFELTQIVTKLTGAAGLPVADGDVDKVLNLVVVLVSEVLAAVKTIVTVTGLQPQLISVLHSVFQILAKVLTLVIGLVGAILPGLIAALSPLLAGLGTGVLAPLLTPVVALLAGLGAGI